MTNPREITKPLISPLQGWKKPIVREKKGRDERIDRMVSYLESLLGRSLDGDVIDNRRACSTMLARLAKDFPQHDPELTLKTLIDAGRQDTFHGPNLTGFRYLVRYGGRIIDARKRAKPDSASKMADALRSLHDLEGK